MDYVQLGRAGLAVSRLCLGSSNFGVSPEKPFALDVDQARPVVARALDMGINFFDSAETYNFGAAESVLGALLNELVPDREDVVISTKFGPGSQRFRINRWGLGRKHILHAVDESLARLRTDYLDIYTIHRLDGITPFEETLEALHQLVASGKVRYIGASSMAAWQFERMLSLQERNGWARFVVMQNQYALNYREEEREMIPLLEDRGIAMTPWGILSAGLLAGTITRDGQRLTARARSDLLRGPGGMVENTTQDFDVQDRVRAVAQRRGWSMAAVALAWALSRPAVTSCLIGASAPAQVEDSVSTLALTLAAEDIAELERGYQPVLPQTLTASVLPQKR